MRAGNDFLLYPILRVRFMTALGRPNQVAKLEWARAVVGLLFSIGNRNVAPGRGGELAGDRNRACASDTECNVCDSRILIPFDAFCTYLVARSHFCIG